MTQITYQATVFTKTVTYTNFKGETKTIELSFALDPMQLMGVIASVETKKGRSKNPAATGGFSDEQQLKFVRDLAAKSAGFASDDGESWEPFEDFEDSLAGKAFMTWLVSSDEGRRTFSETVVLKPFADYVSFVEADPSNTPAEVQQLKTMLSQLSNIFKTPAPKGESAEDRRARLEQELASLEEG